MCDFEVAINYKIETINVRIALRVYFLAPYKVSALHVLVNPLYHVCTERIEHTEASKGRHNLFELALLFLPNRIDIVFPFEGCKPCFLRTDYRGCTTFIFEKGKLAKTAAFRKTRHFFEPVHSEWNWIVGHNMAKDLLVDCALFGHDGAVEGLECLFLIESVPVADFYVEALQLL